MIHTGISHPAHTSAPDHLCSPAGNRALRLSVHPSFLRLIGMRKVAKGNVKFSFLNCLTGSASLPAAQILQHVSYARQRLQKNCCPFSVAGKQRENVPKERMLQEKAVEPKACKIKFVCFVCRSHTESSETTSGVRRDRMKPKAKTRN